MNCDDYTSLYIRLCKHIKKEVLEPEEKHEVNMVLQQMKLQNCLTMDTIMHIYCEKKLGYVRKQLQ